MLAFVMAHPPTKMASNPARIALRNGTRALRLICSKVSVMIGISSVEPRKSRFPYDGKCLPHAERPASLYPFIDAIPYWDTS